MLLCDLCGTAHAPYCYPTDVPHVQWHACAVCVALIRHENWGPLIDRIVTAFAAQQFIPKGEQVAFRYELANALGQPVLATTDM